MKLKKECWILGNKGSLGPGSEIKLKRIVLKKLDEELEPNIKTYILVHFQIVVWMSSQREC